MTSISREGFTIDTVNFIAINTVLSPIITLTIAALIASEPAIIKKASEAAVARFPVCQQLIDRVATSVGGYRLAAYAAAVGSLTLWANRTLNKWALNNWTTDKTWDFNKEVVLVTGAAGGIGQNVIKQLMKRNPKTTFVAVDYIGLKWTPPAGSKLHYYQCDLSNSANIKELAARIKSEVGDPTVVVNNAGLVRGRTVLEGSYQDLELTVRTNLIAPFLICKEFLPTMVKRNHGHIVNLSSLSSVLPPAGVVDYAATKSGLASMGEGLAMELKFRHNAPQVRVSTCILGFIKTPLFKGGMKHANFLMPLMHTDTVGMKIADVIESGYASNVYLPLIGWVLSFFSAPEWLFRYLLEKAQDTAVIFDQPDQKIDTKTGYLKAEV